MENMYEFVELGIELGKLIGSIWWKEITDIICENKKCYTGTFASDLKPLYDKYGYTTVNDVITYLYKKQKAEKEKENANNE